LGNHTNTHTKEALKKREKRNDKKKHFKRKKEKKKKKDKRDEEANVCKYRVVCLQKCLYIVYKRLIDIKKYYHWSFRFFVMKCGFKKASDCT